MRRIGQMSELQNLATFLMADGCEWLTGETIAIDGAGYLATGACFTELDKLTDADWEKARATDQGAERQGPRRPRRLSAAMAEKLVAAPGGDGAAAARRQPRPRSVHPAAHAEAPRSSPGALRVSRRRARQGRPATRACCAACAAWTTRRRARASASPPAGSPTGWRRCASASRRPASCSPRARTAARWMRGAPRSSRSTAGRCTRASWPSPSSSRSERLLLRAHDLAYFGHWITAPGRARRFDTRFFLALRARRASRRARRHRD